MTPATLLVYLVLNSALEWQFDSVVHLNGNGARAMQRWKEEVYHGEPGDLKVVCTEDKGEKT
jgi:hypothetical protein